MASRQDIEGFIQRVQDRFFKNDSGNSPVMMMLGGFKFALNTATFQEVNRATSYRWPSQERVGQYFARQFTGPGDDTITLPGVIYPDFRGGYAQIDNLRSIAEQGRPVKLISAMGDMLGVWVIERIEDSRKVFKPDGTFRKQDFTVTLMRFGDDNADL
jgi:hypothetical protein